MTIEWIENGELKTDEPEPSLKKKILVTTLFVFLLLFVPALRRSI